MEAYRYEMRRTNSSTDVRTLGSELECEEVSNASRCATAGVSACCIVSDVNFPRFLGRSYPVISAYRVLCVDDILDLYSYSATTMHT